jgi:hypothetical protein
VRLFTFMLGLGITQAAFGATLFLASTSAGGYLCQQTALPPNCTVSPTGQWVNGDFIGQSVSGSGLSSVSHLGLDLGYFDALEFALSETYGVTVNGSSVGSFTISGPENQPIHFETASFDFAPIAVGSSFPVVFTITSPTISAGAGSVNWVHDDVTSSLIITGAASIPEPGTLVLAGLSLIALAASGIVGAAIK